MVFCLLIKFQYLADIEEHLLVTIPQIDTDMNVPSDEFDGKVVYGQKRSQQGDFIYYYVYVTWYKIISKSVTYYISSQIKIKTVSTCLFF